MKSAAAKARYRTRPGLAEHANAVLKAQLGVDTLYVRGLAKVTTVALMAAVAFNLLQNLAKLTA